MFKHCYVSWVASYMQDILGVGKGEINIYDSFFITWNTLAIIKIL